MKSIMLPTCLHQLVLIGLCCLVTGDYLSSNPYLIHSSYYRQNNPAFYYPDKYYVSQSRKVQSYAVPKYAAASNYQKVAVKPSAKQVVKQAVKQPQTYRVWAYQAKNVHRWPASNSFARSQYDLNQQVQSESYNRPTYRRTNQIKSDFIKKSNSAVSYQKKIDFLDAKKKKAQPASVCKRPGEVCYGWEPYITDNCCKGYVCDHETKSIVGVCQKKVAVKPMTAKQANIVQRPLTMEELLAGGA